MAAVLIYLVVSSGNLMNNITLLFLQVGGYFAEILGFIIVLPLTMTIIKIFKYLRDGTNSGSIR